MSEHTIWVVMRTRNGAVVPVCWRHTQPDAEAVRDQLRERACVTPQSPSQIFFVIPVTDSVQAYLEDT